MKQKQKLNSNFNYPEDQKQITENQQNYQQKQENNLTSGHFQQQHKKNEQISEVEQNQCKNKQHSDKNQSSFQTKYNIKLVLESQIIEKYEDELQKNDIIYMTSQDQMQKINKNQMKIKNCYKFSHQHKIVQLKFQIGNFLLSLTILNLEAANQNSFFHQKNNVKASSNNFEKASKLNSGGFGDLYLGQTLQGQQFVTKCIKFSKLENFKLDKNHKKRIDEHNKEFLFIVLKQFAITKIASVLSFGPKVLSPFGFDILFTSQCAQFFLEKCLDHKEIQYNQRLEKDLIENFRLMHSIKLMHRDIKPNNILYSKTKQKHIFCDFGISHFVNENVDQQTLTMFSGTWKYISSDMKKLQREGEINLYDNDFYGLRKSLEDFPIQKKEESKDSGNSESVEDSENWTAFLKQKMVLMRLIFNVSKNIFKSLKNLNELDIIKKHKSQVFELFTSSQYREATEEYCKQFIAERIFSLQEGHQMLKKSYPKFGGLFNNCITDKTPLKDSHQQFDLNLALKNIETFKIKSDLAVKNASKSTLSPKKILTNLQRVIKFKKQSLQEYYQMFFRYIKFTQITYNANVEQKLQACTVFLQIFYQETQSQENILLRNSYVQTILLDQAMLQPKFYPIIKCLYNLYAYSISRQSSNYFRTNYTSQILFQLTLFCKYFLKVQLLTNHFQLIFNSFRSDILRFFDQCLKITLNLFVISYKFGSITTFQKVLGYFWNLISRKNKILIISQIEKNKNDHSLKKAQLFETIINNVYGLEKENQDQLKITNFQQKFKQLNIIRYPNVIRFFKAKKFDLLTKRGKYQQQISHFLNNNHLQNKNTILNIEFCSFIQFQMDQGNIQNVRRHLKQIDAKLNCDQVFQYFFLNIRLFFYNRGIQMLIKKYVQKDVSLSEIKQQNKQNQKFQKILQTIQNTIDSNLQEICKDFIVNCINSIHNFCINKKSFNTIKWQKQTQILKRFALLPEKVLKKIQSLSQEQYQNLQLNFQIFYRVLCYVIEKEDQPKIQYLQLINKLQLNQNQLAKNNQTQYLYQKNFGYKLKLIFLKSLYYLTKKQFRLSCNQASKVSKFQMKQQKDKTTLQAYCRCLQNYIQSATFLLFQQNSTISQIKSQQTNKIYKIVLNFYQRIIHQNLLFFCFNGVLVQCFLKIFIKTEDIQNTYEFLFFLTSYITKNSQQINFDRMLQWIQFLENQVPIISKFPFYFLKVCQTNLNLFEAKQNKYIFVFYLLFLRRILDSKVVSNSNKEFQQIFNVLIFRMKESYRVGINQEIQRRTIKTFYSFLIYFYKEFKYFPQKQGNEVHQKRIKKSFFIKLKSKKKILIQI